MSEPRKTALGIVRELELVMRCNCDLDSWEPEPITGHSCVCRIHRATTERRRTHE